MARIRPLSFSKIMLIFGPFIFGLIVLVTGIYGGDSGLLKLNNECQLLLLLESVTDIATLCSDFSARTYTSFVTVVPGGIDTIFDRTTLTGVLTSSMTTVDVIYLTTIAYTHEQSDSTELLIKTSYSTTTVTTNSINSLWDFPGKKRRGLTVESSTFNVNATLDVVVLDMATPTTEATFVLVPQTTAPINSLIALAASNVIYTTSAPQILTQLINNDQESMESNVGTVLGATYTEFAITTQFAIELDEFCTCLYHDSDVTTTIYSTIIPITTTETAMALSTSIVMNILSEVSQIKQISTIVSLSTTTVSTSVEAEETYACYLMASDPYLSSFEYWNVTIPDGSNVSIVPATEDNDATISYRGAIYISQIVPGFIIGDKYWWYVENKAMIGNISGAITIFGETTTYSSLYNSEGDPCQGTVTATSESTLFEMFFNNTDDTSSLQIVTVIILGYNCLSLSS